MGLSLAIVTLASLLELLGILKESGKRRVSRRVKEGRETFAHEGCSFPHTSGVSGVVIPHKLQGS